MLLFIVRLSPCQQSNTDLQRLVELLQTIVLSDRAASTVSSYSGAANRWIDWCKLYSFSPLTANPMHFTSQASRIVAGLAHQFLSQLMVLPGYIENWDFPALLTIRLFPKPWLALNASWQVQLTRKSLYSPSTSEH